MKKLLAVIALCAAVVLPAHAVEPAWPSLKSSLFGERLLLDGKAVIAIDAPYRTDDDARAPIAARIEAPHDLALRRVTVIVDDNPMPVSAVFELDAPQPQFFFDLTLRINGPTPVHVVAETTDGRLFVAETFVKTSGKGACAAPPGTDPELALATLGDIEIGIHPVAGDSSLGERLAALHDRLKQVDVDVRHPSHSGMQMDQISLLFIPMRYVETLDVDLNGDDYLTMTGSITLSENPRISLSAPASTQSVDVTMTDTSGTVTHAHEAASGF